MKNNAKEVQSKLLEPIKTKEKKDLAELRKIIAIKLIDDGNKNIKIQLQSNATIAVSKRIKLHQ